MTVIINDMFPNAKAYATEKNARRKLEKFSDAIPSDSATVVVRRSDGKWLAVVLVRNSILNIPFLCQNGICVTN